VLLAALALCALAALTVGQASAALMGQPGNTPFEAIYGNPPAAGPLGGGLGMNFGFGENMLFEAKEGVTGEEKISISIPLIAGGNVVSAATDSFIGGTLMSNKTGVKTPLSFTVQFADFQNNSVGGVTAPATAAYSDTSDRPWITEICPFLPATNTCSTDPLFATPRGSVEISDVSVNIGPTGGLKSVTVQGTVWGVWEDGAANTPPCIKLSAKPGGAAADQTLITTKTGAESGIAVGKAIAEIKGKACLLSANNDWNTATKPAITIKDE